ncbi:hypothetical protein TNIN_327001 [Trichonephila inaurata madagascariensis]|uniref:Uncharacterized protein n=1 Tax=Trichonephila inaurata madagascariensis TaxID=2747483 RepID=A0A8X6MK79_9ARAC|nr:hypothetical protein TNIN_327001 [Trichonephila inaurata madagascariensis]
MHYEFELQHIPRQQAIENQREQHEFELQKLRFESDLDILWLETEIENSQLVRNTSSIFKQRKIITNSTNSKTVCSQVMVIDLRSETYIYTLLNVANENLVAVEISASNVQTNGQNLKGGENVAFSVVSFDSEIIFVLFRSVLECWKSNLITLLNESDTNMCIISFKLLGLLQFCLIL